MLKKLLLAATVTLLAAGCSTAGHLGYSADPFLQSVQSGADDLAAHLVGYKLSAPVIVASAQNNDQLSQVCPQGRLISDIVSSRLTQHGIPVKEVRLGQKLRINQTGETILSRDLSLLAQSSQADAVVTATWSTVAPPVKQASFTGSEVRYAGTTYVTLKAIRVSDGLVLSSQTFVPPASWTCEVGD
jgi:hypothetical protein